MPTPNYIYFGLAGDFDPDALNAEIDLPPSRSTAKHSRDPEKKIPRCSLVRFGETQAEEGDSVFDLYELADRAIGHLEPYTSQFVEAIRKHEAEPTLQVVFEFPVSDDVSTPALGFSSRVIRFVAATGASIDLDSYRG